MTQIFNVGPTAEDPPEEVSKDFVWIVYHYHYESWEGNGDAIGLTRAGELMHAGLGHCSCYGPWEGGWSNKPRDWDRITIADLDSTNVHVCDYPAPLIDKVKQLLNMI